MAKGGSERERREKEREEKERGEGWLGGRTCVREEEGGGRRRLSQRPYIIEMMHSYTLPM